MPYKRSRFRKLSSSICIRILSEKPQRPSAKDLLQHKFIKSARKTSYLTELVERYQDFRSRTQGKPPQMYQATVRNSGAWDGTLRSDWSFDTVRTSSIMGSMRSVARDLMPSDMIPDEDDYDDDPSMYDDEGTINTTAATNGGSAALALGMNAGAQHSTVIIRPMSPLPTDEKAMPSLMSDNVSDETAGSTGPETPPANEPPPAYSGSMRSTRRASYQARNNLSGTVIGEADLGTGVDTIRPVKKVDTIRSLRMSEEFVGTTKSREGGGSVPSSPTSTKKSHRRAASDAGKAGKSIVDDVVLPILSKVRQMLCTCGPRALSRRLGNKR